MNKQDYQNHINSLAEELGCRVDQRPNLEGMMYVELGYIEGPTVENQIHYLINLHELGHVAHQHTQGRPPHQDKRFYFDNGVLRSEAQAWEWAFNKCLGVPIEDATRRFMWDTCLGSYYLLGYVAAKGKPTRLYNGNRHHVEFVFDHPNEYFDGVVRRIQGSLTDFKIPYKGRVRFEPT